MYVVLSYLWCWSVHWHRPYCCAGSIGNDGVSFSILIFKSCCYMGWLVSLKSCLSISLPPSVVLSSSLFTHSSVRSFFSSELHWVILWKWNVEFLIQVGDSGCVTSFSLFCFPLFCSPLLSMSTKPARRKLSRTMYGSMMYKRCSSSKKYCSFPGM